MIASWAAHSGPWLLVILLFAVLIEGARRLALATGSVARPNPIVSAHRAPVPYLGGIGLVLGYALALPLVLPGALAWGTPRAFRVLAALAFMGLGAWDDLRPLGPWSKLLFQGVLCAAYLVATGEPPGLRFVLVLLFMVLLVNAYNVVDVMDGLLCLVAVAAFVALLSVSRTIAPGTRVELGVLVAGAAALFLFNRPPARIYAGDAGSMAVGFLVAALIRAAASAEAGPRALAFLGVCAVPLFEVALLVPARLAAGRSPLRGSPDHFALRLQDRLGWSRWRVLAVTAAACAACAPAPFLAERLAAGPLVAYAVAVLALGIAAWWAVWRIPPPRNPGAASAGPEDARAGAAPTRG